LHVRMIELAKVVAVPIIDAFDAPDGVRQDALTDIRPHARTLHERLSRSANVVENPGYRSATRLRIKSAALGRPDGPILSAMVPRRFPKPAIKSYRMLSH